MDTLRLRPGALCDLWLTGQRAGDTVAVQPYLAYGPVRRPVPLSDGSMLLDVPYLWANAADVARLLFGACRWCGGDTHQSPCPATGDERACR